MKAWTEKTYCINVYRAESGWIIRRQSSDGRMQGEDIAGLSDDEGLIEWFQAQLGFGGHKRSEARPPNPGPRTDVAGAPAPAADALTQALEPLVPWVKSLWHRHDSLILWNHFDQETTAYFEVTLSNLRDLIRAAGLWTDDMQAAPALVADAPSAAPAADTTPPAGDDNQDEEVPF